MFDKEPKTPIQVDKLWTPIETSLRLGFRAQTPHTVLKLIREGQLKAARINSRVIRISESEIQRFLEKNST